MFKTLVLSAMLGVAAAAGEYVGKGGAVSESLESAAVARAAHAHARADVSLDLDRGWQGLVWPASPFCGRD